MVRRSKGPRRKSRQKLRQKPGYRPPITKFLQSFEINERVAISIEPSSQRGMPPIRFRGRVGIIKGKRGKSYLVEIKDGNKIKTLIVRPEHLRRVA